jgi:small GTP-binding protein
MEASVSEGSEYSVPLKIAVLGQSMVGKSALTFRFINNRFPTEHDTTIEDSYSIPAKIDDIQCQLEILDTAGQDDYQTMLDTWINSADGFLLVYSIDNRDSFESTKTRFDRILKLKQGHKISVVIVGNKCDLEDRRQVPKEEVENYFRKINKSIVTLESSALNTINVKESFLCVARGLLQFSFPEKYKNMDSKGGKKKCYCF